MRRLFYVCIGFCLAASLVYVGTISGCQNTPDNVPVDSGKPLIVESKNDVGTAAERLTQTTATIEDNTNQIVAKTPEPVKTEIAPQTTAILQSTAQQTDIVNDLKATQEKLATAEKLSGDFEQKFLDEQARRQKAEDSESKALKKAYRNASLLCGLAALVFGGLFFSGQLWAKWLAVLCAAGCAGCIFIVQTVDLIPWVVLGAVVIAVSLFVWQFIKKNRSIKTKIDENVKLHTVTKELTATVEASKPFMTQQGRKDLFGDGPVPGKVALLQKSDLTQKLVSKYRAELPNRAPKVDETIAIDVNGDGVIDELDFPVAKFRTRPRVEVPSPVKKCGIPRSITETRGKIILN